MDQATVVPLTYAQLVRVFARVSILAMTLSHLCRLV